MNYLHVICNFLRSVLKTKAEPTIIFHALAKTATILKEFELLNRAYFNNNFIHKSY